MLLLIPSFVFLFLGVFSDIFNILDDLFDPGGIDFSEFDIVDPEEGNLSLEFHARHVIFGRMSRLLELAILYYLV